jgi:hypothetical protein
MGLPKTDPVAHARAAELDQFFEFGARRHWKTDWFGGGGGHRSAWRDFSYRCGAKARVQIDRPDDWRRMWEAGLWVSFSTGPQGSFPAGRFAPVRDWAVLAEQVLEAPLALEKAQTPAALDAVFRTVDRLKAWWTVCIVFDLDYFKLSHREAFEKLTTMQAPQMASR